MDHDFFSCLLIILETIKAVVQNLSPLNIFILIHQLPDYARGCSLGNLQFPRVRKVGQTYSLYLTVFSTPEAKC